MTSASPVWRKAAAASHNAGRVEVAVDGPAVLLRNSREPEGPRLVFNTQEWQCFLDGVVSGEFDLPSSLGTGSTSWTSYNQDVRLS